MLTYLDQLPANCTWRSPIGEARELLAKATDAELAAELRKPTTCSPEMRDAAIREAIARIIERPCHSESQ